MAALLCECKRGRGKGLLAQQAANPLMQATERPDQKDKLW